MTSRERRVEAIGQPTAQALCLRTMLGAPGALKALPDLGLVPGGKGLPRSERDRTGAVPRPCQAVSGADSRLVKLGFLSWGVASFCDSNAGNLGALLGS